MATFFLSTNDYNSFIRNLSAQYRVFGLKGEEKNFYWSRLTAEKSEHTPNRYRALTPVKSFFFPVKEEVTAEPPVEKTILLGVKACDLAHLQTTDAIFLQGALADPYYAIKRQNTIIISSDCDSYIPACFCTLMGGLPYPTKGFDLNLTPVREGFLIETGTQAGEDLAKANTSLFAQASRQQLAERDNLRNKMTELLKANNKDFTWTNPKDIVTAKYASQKWESDIAKTCVECDACRFACGTCYCFLLAESKKSWERIRSWDSCQSEGYGRVAGGANPRKTKGERLRNLYSCKLQYRPENFGFYACTGCGRCIEACQGKIDIRKSLQKLSEER